MRRYFAAFMLAFVLMFGMVSVAHASTDTTSSHQTFSWSAVTYKAIFGILIAAPAVVYFSLNNRKDK